MATLQLLGIDLGAESGRAMLGRFDGERIVLEEIRRFSTPTLSLPDGLHWDIERIRAEVERGIAAAAAVDRLDAVGIDTWGVDYGLLDDDGRLLSSPFHYRDSRTAGMVDVAHRRLPSPAWWYERTGCQTIPLNTAFQLLADEHAGRLSEARTLLLLPNLLAYWLTGVAAAEQTIASTTQLFDPVRRDWAGDVISALGLPIELFPPVVAPGAILGPLTADLCERTGAPPELPFALCGSHDTASAFAAVPAEPGTMLISSGTWSLIGVERAEPLMTEAARLGNFTNEGGVRGTTRFLRNAAGMWLVQECRRAWAMAGTDWSYADLSDAAASARPFGPIVDPDNGAFLDPGNMPARIAAECRRTGQAAPQTPGEFVRCALESLALRYRWMAERLEAVTGEPIRRVRIVGGGARNVLHCQLTADATGLPVVGGPDEATALGNVMTQVLALGAVSSLDEVRAVIARSVDVATYEPGGDRARWDEHNSRFLALVG